MAIINAEIASVEADFPHFGTYPFLGRGFSLYPFLDIVFDECYLLCCECIFTFSVHRVLRLHMQI